MKKFFCGAVLIVFLLGSALSEGILLEAGSHAAPQQVLFSQIAIAGDAVYVWEEYEGALYRILPESQGVEKMDTEGALTRETADGPLRRAPVCLFESGGALHAVAIDILSEDGSASIEDSALYRWEFSSDGALEQDLISPIDLSGFAADGPFGVDLPKFYGAVLADGVLFALVSDANSASGSSGLAFYLESGARAQIPVQGIYRILGVRDGKMLFATKDARGVSIRCGTFEDSESETLLEIPSANGTPPVCLHYDADSDALYYIADGLRRLSPASPEDAALISNIPINWCTRAVADGKLAAVTNGEAVFATPIGARPSAVETLSVLGGFPPRIAKRFLTLHPNVSLEVLPFKSDNEILAAMLSQAEKPDIFVFASSEQQAYVPLRDRGYLVELDGARAQALASSVYTEIRRELYGADGLLRAIPVDCLAYGKIGVNRDLWRSLALGNPPETWDEMLDFLLDRWPECARSDPELRLMAYGTPEEIRRMFGYALHADYDCYRSAHADKLPYGTDIYIRLLEKFASIPFADGGFEGGYDAEKILFTDWFLPTPGISMVDGAFSYLPLSIEREIGPRLELSVYFACVNPYSSHLSLARDLLEYAAENVDARVLAALSPDQNAPVKSALYDQIIEEYGAEKSELEGELLAADTNDRRNEIEARLEELEANYLLAMEHAAYDITTESVEAYRRAAANGLVVSFSLNNSFPAGDALRVKQAQFFDGWITAEEFAAALDKELYMRELEEG